MLHVFANDVKVIMKIKHFIKIIFQTYFWDQLIILIGSIFRRTNMYASILESARNSTFRNPIVTTVNCEPAENATQNFISGQTIAAAAVAEGGSNKFAL